MHGADLLADAVRLLGIAAGVALVCLRLRVPPVVGLLAAGAIVGPTGLGWIPARAEIERFAEIGVVLLLFLIGLEFSRERLRELGRPLRIAGPVQTVGTALLAGVAAAALGVAPRAAVVVGAAVSLSSTALLLKLLADRDRIGSLDGKSTLAILIFQDLLVVPLLLLVPLLAGDRTGPGEMGRLGIGFLLLLAAVGLGRVVMPRLLAFAARRRSREAFVLAAVGLCLGMAWLSARYGLSPALGAFLGGLLLADSEYAHPASAELLPLREIFAGIFFLALGMLLDLRLVASMPGTLLAVTAGVIVIKVAGAGAATRALGLPARNAAAVAVGLAQVGEFSFVLLELGREGGLLDPGLHQLLLASAALSMLATPGLVALAPRIGSWWAGLVAGPTLPPTPETADPSPQVVVVGYGENGRILARILGQSGVRYRVLDADPARVSAGRRAGEPMVFGDATRDEALERAGVAAAHVVVIAISDPEAAAPAARRVRRISPAAQLLVRTRRLREIEALERAGADRVVAEEYETAIEVYTWVLERMHVPRNVIAAQTRVLRGEDYRILRDAATGAVSRSVVEALAAGTTDVFRVLSESAACGRTLGELDLRRRSGASVIALVRGERSELALGAESRLEAGDDLVLVGAHSEIERAFELLRGGD